MLLSPYFTLTWYPGAYPAVADPVVLQSGDHYVESGAPFSGTVEKLVQRADFLRGVTPQFYDRGNRSTALQWEESRYVAAPGAALATALAIIEAMPAGTGWLRIAVTDEDRAWALEPCLIRSAGWRHDPVRATLTLRWSLEGGIVSEIAVAVPDEDYLLTETGFTLLCEDSSEMALESHT